MARPKKKIDSVKVTITTSPRVIDFLEALLKTEVYGTTVSEVAEQLIKRAMEESLISGKIHKLNQEI